MAKKGSSEAAKARRQSSWTRGQERKAKRREENEARHTANVVAGTFRPRFRLAKNDPARFKVCDRCSYRRIVAGSVCVCRSIGAAS